MDFALLPQRGTGRPFRPRRPLSMAATASGRMGMRAAEGARVHGVLGRAAGCAAIQQSRRSATSPDADAPPVCLPAVARLRRGGRFRMPEVRGVALPKRASCSPTPGRPVPAGWHGRENILRLARPRNNSGRRAVSAAPAGTSPKMRYCLDRP